MKKILKILLEIFVTVVVVVMLLEVGLRMYESISLDFKKQEKGESAYVEVPFLEFRLRPNMKFDEDQEIYRFFHTNFDTNSYGFRENKPYGIEKLPGVYRIICMGASTTFGHAASSNSATYPALLETTLSKSYPDNRFEVLNMGIPGFNILQQLILFNTETLSFKPDMVVIYSGWCDLTNIFSVEDSRYEGMFVGDNRFSQYKEKKENKYFSDSKSAILRRVGRWQYKADKKKRKISDAYKQVTDVETRRQIMSDSITSYYNNDLYFNRYIEIYKNSLESVALIAKSKDIDVVFVTLPFVVKTSSPDSYFEIFKNKFSGSVSLIKGDIYTESRLAIQGRLNNIIRDIAKRNNCILVDTVENLPKNEKVFDLFSDEIHFSDEGNQFLAELISDIIKKRNIDIDNQE